MQTITPQDLTEQQKMQWGETMSIMGWKCPGFQHIFYRLLTKSNNKYYCVPTRDVPIAATDGKNILINPDTFFKSDKGAGYGLTERLFIAAHEVVHNVYSDVELLHRCQKTGRVPMHDGTDFPFKNMIMQHAMDYRINALLVDSRIGSLPKDALYDLKIAKANDSVLDVYRKLYEQHGGDESALGSGGFDTLLAPGTSTGQDPSQAASDRNPGQWQVEIAAAQTLEQMKSQGHMALGLKRMFQQILEPEVPWTDHIRTIIKRRVGSGSYDWHRPDRRFIVRDIYMPGRSGFGAGWLVIWGDTSGSIGQGELERYIGEIAGIIEDVKPRRLTVCWCDANIHHIDELTDAADLAAIKSRGVGGGGGTSVDPVLKWITDQLEDPDMLIAFTDGYVTFPPKPPSFPVLWASTTDKAYPYGEVVRINPSQDD